MNQGKQRQAGGHVPGAGVEAGGTDKHQAHTFNQDPRRGGTLKGGQHNHPSRRASTNRLNEYFVYNHVTGTSRKVRTNRRCLSWLKYL